MRIETLEEFTTKLEYEWDKLIGYTRLSDEFWRYSEAPKVAVSQFESWLFDGISVIVKWRVAKRQLLEYKWPTTWRDALKERWFPNWAKARWPVRYTKIDLTELAAIKRPPKDIPLRYHIGIGHEREPDA